jgi:quercetin dioxygenase-like cupin family protein
MQHYQPLQIAEGVVAARASVPGMALVHDSDAVRMIVFRIEPGQQVAQHTSPSTVVLTVLHGAGQVLRDGEPVPVTAGDVVVYAPRELHGMRAVTERFIVMATITPRPGSGA